MTLMFLGCKTRTNKQLNQPSSGVSCSPVAEHAADDAGLLLAEQVAAHCAAPAVVGDDEAAVQVVGAGHQGGADGRLPRGHCTTTDAARSRGVQTARRALITDTDIILRYLTLLSSSCLLTINCPYICTILLMWALQCGLETTSENCPIIAENIWNNSRIYVRIRVYMLCLCQT